MAMIRRKRHDSQAFEEAWNARARGTGGGWDAEIVDLVESAEQICRAAVAEPSAEFRSALRVQLLAEAENVLSPKDDAAVRLLRPRPRIHAPTYAVRRRLAGATAAFVGAAGFVGLVGTSAQALPGEMLYPVKRGVENVQLAFSNDDVSRGEFRLSQASERLAEARRLTDDGSAQGETHVAGALDDFASQAKDGSDSMFRSFGQSGSTSSITAVNDFSAAAAADLAQLAGELPSEADPSFQNATETVSDLIGRAARLCSSCDPVDVTSLLGVVTSLEGSNPSTPIAPQSADGPSAEAPDTNGPASTTNPGPKLTVPSLPVGPPTASAPTTSAPQLKDVTDPLVGGLLGDDEQPGLVPSLLNGLLGNNNP